MRAGLYEVLTSTPGVRSGGEMQAIAENLDRIFNSRRESLAHLPEFGLPDLSEVYRDAPESIERLRQAILQAAVRYEPRLQQVRVTHDDGNPYDMRLVFRLSAVLRDGRRVVFETTFASQSEVEVTCRAARPGV